MTVRRHETRSWIHAIIHPSIAYLSIISVATGGTLSIIKSYDSKADSATYYAKRDLAELESDLFYPDFRSTEIRMERTAQDTAGNQNLELFCGIPNREVSHQTGSHETNPTNDAAFIVIHFAFCSAVDKASQPGFNPHGEYPNDIISESAVTGIFTLAHEIGHDEVGTSEIAANCYAAINYEYIAHTMSMPDAIAEIPQNPDRFCN